MHKYRIIAETKKQGMHHLKQKKFDGSWEITQDDDWFIFEGIGAATQAAREYLQQGGVEILSIIKV